jgi:hypothetical protein
MASRGKLLAARIGRRGSALLFFAVLDLVWCYGLLTLPRPLSPVYAWMQHILPLWAWAGCWGAVALICIVCAFLTRDTPAFVAAISIKVGWGLLSFFGWLSGAVDRGYVSAVIWLAFAAFVFLVAGGIPPPPPKKVVVWIRS